VSGGRFQAGPQAIDDTPQTVARLRDAARRERRVGLVAVRDRLGERARGQRGPLTGPNPTDHGKLGSKIHVICDRNGLPLSVGISGANLHDSQALIPLMRGIPPIRSRYGPRRRRPAKLHADKGYDFDHLPQLATATTDSASHCPPRRRVVGSFGAAF
jgi:transposase